MKKIKLPKTIQLNSALKLTSKYLHMIIFIVFAIMMGMTIQRAGNLSNSEPSASEIKDKISSLGTKKVDQDSLDKLKELQEQSVSIESLFDNGRTNPFEN